MEPSTFDVRVSIHDAPASTGWRTLWQRLLAPLPTEAASVPPMRVSFDGVPDSSIDAFTAATLEAEAR